MKYAMVLLTLVTALSLAVGEFATGGSELFKFSGYNKFRFSMWGSESNDPSSGFDFYNYTSWDPTVSEMFNAQLSFDTKYAYNTDFTLKLGNAWINMNLLPEFAIMAGRFKLPFGLAFYRSSFTMPYTNRAYVASSENFDLYGGRDVGVRAMADFGPVNLDLAFTNGTDAIADTSSNKQFTARLQGQPAEWATIGAAVAMIGEPELHTGSATTEAWSATGMDFFAYAKYPVGENTTLNFEGEYMTLPFNGPEIDDQTNEAAVDYYASIGATFGVDMGFVTAIQPSVRYESFTPAYQLASESDAPDNGLTLIDFGLNLHSGSMNTLRIGGRNYSPGEDWNTDQEVFTDTTSVTDIYLTWLMKF